MPPTKKLFPILLMSLLLIWRTWYGLSQNFWHEDIVQIYLLGLKYFSTGMWPYFGPDIVHTQQQIPGAMQSILIAIPLQLIPLPESPFVLVNLLSMIGIGALSYFYSQRFRQFSLPWLIVLIATLPAVLQISTNVYNPSYLLFPSCLFFVAWFESQAEFRSLGLSALSIGLLLDFSLCFTFQIHMSWPILLPFLAIVFCRSAKGVSRVKLLWGFGIGCLIGGSFLFPTILKYGLNTLWASGSKNSGFVLDQILDAPNTVIKLITLGSYEYFGFNLGSSMNERISIIRANYPLTLSAMVMTATFIVTIILLFYGIKKALKQGFKQHPDILLFALASAWCAIIFTLTPRPAALRNIFLLLPVTLTAFLSCLSMLKADQLKKFVGMLSAAMLASFIFHTIIAIKMIPNVSIYKDYAKVSSAINDKNYEILGTRRPGHY